LMSRKAMGKAWHERGKSRKVEWVSKETGQNMIEPVKWSESQAKRG